MSPAVIVRPLASRPITVVASTDLPEPDSPTMHSVRPASMRTSRWAMAWGGRRRRAGRPAGRALRARGRNRELRRPALRRARVVGDGVSWRGPFFFSSGAAGKLGIEHVAQAVAQQVDGQHRGHQEERGPQHVAGACENSTRPSAMMLPQVGTSDGRPSPRKLRMASVSTAEAAMKVPCTISGASALGRMSRHRMVALGVARRGRPLTKGSSRRPITSARTRRVTRGTSGTAMARITVGSVVPSMATRVMASSTAGMAMSPSITRISTASAARKVARQHAQRAAQGHGQRGGEAAHHQRDAGAVEHAAPDVAAHAVAAHPEGVLHLRAVGQGDGARCAGRHVDEGGVHRLPGRWCPARAPAGPAARARPARWRRRARRRGAAGGSRKWWGSWGGSRSWAGAGQGVCFFFAVSSGCAGRGPDSSDRPAGSPRRRSARRTAPRPAARGSRG